MLKNLLVVLACVVCVVNGWVVFPLPTVPAPAQPARSPVTLKPTPVLPSYSAISSTGVYSLPKPYNLKPSAVKPVLSTQEYNVPANDLLPPKVIS